MISTNPSFSEGIIVFWNPKDQTEVNTSSRRVARQVLIYLESADKNAKPRYTFGNGAIPTGNSRPSNYFKNKPTSKDILIQIFHTKKGKVVAINFGKNGYMVTMIAGKEPTIVKDGNCLHPLKNKRIKEKRHCKTTC